MTRGAKGSIPLAAIGEGETAGMPQHMRMDMADTGTLSGGRKDVVDGLPGERLLPLGDEQPGQPIAALSEPAPDRAQFVTIYGMLGIRPV